MRAYRLYSRPSPSKIRRSPPLTRQRRLLQPRLRDALREASAGAAGWPQLHVCSAHAEVLGAARAVFDAAAAGFVRGADGGGALLALVAGGALLTFREAR